MHSIMPLMFMAYGGSEHQECRNVIWLRFRPISLNIYALKKMGIKIGVEEKYICYVSLSLFVFLSHLLCLAPLFTFELLV